MRKGLITVSFVFVMGVLFSGAWAQEKPETLPGEKEAVRGPRADRPAGPMMGGGLRLFQMLDANDDGLISMEEFQAQAGAGPRRMRNRDRDRDMTGDRLERPRRDRFRFSGPEKADNAPPPADMERPMRGRDREPMEDRPNRPMGPRGRFGRSEGEQGLPLIAHLEQRVREIVREELAKLRTPGDLSAKGTAFCPPCGGPRREMRWGRMDADRPGPRAGRFGQGWRSMEGWENQPSRWLRPGQGPDGGWQVEEIREAIRMLERALDNVDRDNLTRPERGAPTVQERPEWRMDGPSRRFGRGPRGGFPGEGFRGGPGR